MAFSPAELVLASLSGHGQVYCYDLQTFDTISHFPCSSSPTIQGDPQEDEGRCITFHPDGTVITIATTRTFQAWHWEEPECHALISAQWGRVADMNVLQDENKLVAASIDQSFVHLWGANLAVGVAGLLGGLPPCTNHRFSFDGLPCKAHSSQHLENESIPAGSSR